MKRAYLPLVLFGFALFVSACGGGGGGGNGSSSALPHAPNAPQASAIVHVVIPKSDSPGSSARKPAFVSPSTATITVGLYTVNGATPNPLPSPISVEVSPSPSAGCTVVSGGTSCTITVAVPVATAVVLQISSFDASGNLLGQGLVGPINTTLATIPTQTVSIGGVPATILLSPAGLAAGDDGATHTIAFAVSAEDAGGNTIIPPGAYPNPIALSITGDTNSALSLSTSSVASPGPSNGASTVTLTYNSAKAITQATITATSGSSTASIPFAPIVFTPTSAALLVGGSMQAVTVSEAGYAGAFTPSGASSTATVTCVPANCTPSSTGGSVTLDITPGSSAGSETVSIVDANGGFANIPVTVTTTNGGGSLVGAPYKIYEYPTSSGGTNYGITVGPDGQTLWFVDQANASLGAIPNPSGCNSTTCASSEAPVPYQSAPPTNLLAISAASDGNLYVTDVGNNGSDLGNLVQAACTPSPASCTGTSYVYYDIYDDNAPNLTDVVGGPDGNLYISAASDCCDNSAIAWDPIVGCCGSYPYDIYVAGQPSAINMMTFDQTGQTLWFTDQGNANVGFVTGLPCEVSCYAIEQPSGSSYSNYGPQGGAAHRPPPRGVASRMRGGGAPLPRHAIVRRRALCCGLESSFTGPLEGIVAAPDGNIYVADASGSIDGISPSTWEACSGSGCTFVAIGLPIAGASPQNLTVGPDGNVWFTDATGYVGFVSLNSCKTGTCKAYEYNVGGSPWGITAGPDGNIWFTDSSTNKIGKVVLQ
jgi:streptogramin lyase